MGLPNLSIPEYTLELPSSNKKLKYRAMLSGEEKILLLAKHSESNKEIISAIHQVLRNCTFDEIDTNSLSILDFEFLFLHLLMKSKGEESIIGMKCENGHTNEIVIDLREYQIKGELLDSNIVLEENIGIMMKPLSLNLMGNIDNSETKYEQNMSLIKGCIDYVYDKDQVTYLKDLKSKDIDKWLATLTHQQIEDIIEYINSIPKISYKVNQKCLTCESVIETEIEGIENFF